MATPMTYQVDPLNSPQFFRTGTGGDDTSSADTFRDSALIQTLSQLPGAEAFFRAAGGGDDTSAAGINPTALAQFLQQNGYSIFDDPTGNGGTLRVMQGDREIGREQYSNQDTNFGIASAIVGALGGSYLGGLNGLGAIGSGAMAGANAGGLNDPSLQSILSGAAIGGAMGGIRDYFSTVSPLSPMEVPSADWQNIPTGDIQAALNQSIPQLDPTYAPISTPPSFNPAMLESMIGTPGYGVNAAADAYLEGIGSQNLSGVNATVPPEYLNNGNWNASGTLPSTPVTPTQTINVNGQPIDYGDGSAFPSATPTSPTPTDLPQADYSHEGNNYPTPESTQGPGGSPVNASPSVGSKYLDFFKANPRLAMSLIGSVLGGVGGGSSQSGTGGASSQGGMTATQAPKFQRQYVAPPAGYRPGFDPEHKYFTGIGNVGTGG